MERGVVAMPVFKQGALLSRWYKGDVKAGWASYSSTEGKAANLNLAFRCVGCGLVEFYATSLHEEREAGPHGGCLGGLLLILGVAVVALSWA
jgi:hypothetical protein